MRRPRTLVLATAAGGVVLAVWAGLALWTYAQRPQVTGRAAAVVPDVRAAGARAGRERRQPRRPRGDASTARTPPPSCARPARASSSSSTASPTARTRCTSQAQPERASSATPSTTTFTIHVDTHKPELGAQPRAARLAPDHRDQRPRRARLEARAELRGPPRPRDSRRSGAFALDPDLPDGRTTVRLIASDRAGNRSVITRTIAVDGTPPRLHLDRVPALVGTRAPDAARLARRRLARDRAGQARRRLRRAARARRQGAARRGRGQGPLLAAAAAPRPGRAPPLDHGDRLGRQHVHGRGRPVHGRLDREAALLDRARHRRARRRRRAARAPAQGLRRLQGPVHALLQRAHRGRRARSSRASTTCRSPASRRRSCCSSAPSASSCTSSASAST